MASPSDGPSLDADDPPDPPPSSPETTHQSSRAYPVVYSGSSSNSQMNIYSYSSKDFAPQALRSKRRQVKNACTNCQKACKKCDDARPCLRCVKYGISEECIDSQRKERKKGVKRGPYKKRDGKGSNVDPIHGSPNGVPASNNGEQSSPSPAAPCLPIGYPPGYYTSYQPLEKSNTEPPLLYSSAQYLLAAFPNIHSQPDSPLPESTLPFQTQGYYQTAVYAPVQHSQYVISRSNPQASFPGFGGPVLQKHTHYDGQGEVMQSGSFGPGDS